MAQNTAYENPVKAYAPTDVLKDSKLWDYLTFLQVNRLNFISTIVFDEDKQVKNKLFNQISTLSRLETMVWDDINPQKKDSKKVLEYWQKKPKMFNGLTQSTDHLRQYILGDHFQQIKLQVMLDDWFKQLTPFMNSMKKTKRTSFIAGEGAYMGGDLPLDEEP